eukprot:6713050-Ditylum_brightwellii.AAC.1
MVKGQICEHLYIYIPVFHPGQQHQNQSKNPLTSPSNAQAAIKDRQSKGAERVEDVTEWRGRPPNPYLYA